MSRLEGKGVLVVCLGLFNHLLTGDAARMEGDTQARGLLPGGAEQHASWVSLVRPSAPTLAAPPV